ncbi:MAG: hypothetical protein JW850_16150 [Thermoflexales bacterium]|nr:hypothetical protein [Thermoflexales bacterium]
MSIYNPLDFGAKGDGATNDAAAIQQAIDVCAAAGGGTVLIPAGQIFLSGALMLKSNVELHLERGATLRASHREADYPPALRSDAISQGEVREDELPNKAFLVAYRAENIALTGSGVIDGHGRAFVAEDLGHIYRMAGDRQYFERPFTLFFIGCTNLILRDLTIRDAAFWTVRLAGCEDVVIHALRILNDLKLPNNDGIDLDRCRSVRISDCHIVAGDDAICLKACRGTAAFGACENITVVGCTLTTTSSALKIGNECRAPVRNVIFDACVIRSSHRGLSVHLGESGNVENILFSNMIIETRIFHQVWWGRGEPIYLTAIPWVDQVGHVRHVRFSNVLARSENGVFIQGWTPGLIEDVVLENVRVELDKWSKWPGGRQDLRPCPGEGLPAHPTAGFFIRQAADVTLRNCQVVWGPNRPDYFGPALESHAVTGLVTENFRGAAAHPDRCAAIVSD